MKDVTIKQSGGPNALVHGLYAKDVLLPWDRRDDFEKLHADLKAEFFPRGRAEEEAVLDLHIFHWNKQTVWRMRQTAVLKDPFTLDILQTNGKSWSKIRKRLRSQPPTSGRCRAWPMPNTPKLLSQVEAPAEKTGEQFGHGGGQAASKKR